MTWASSRSEVDTSQQLGVECDDHGREGQVVPGGPDEIHVGSDVVPLVQALHEGSAQRTVPIVALVRRSNSTPSSCYELTSSRP